MWLFGAHSIQFQSVFFLFCCCCCLLFVMLTLRVYMESIIGMMAMVVVGDVWCRWCAQSQMASTNHDMYVSMYTASSGIHYFCFRFFPLGFYFKFIITIKIIDVIAKIQKNSTLETKQGDQLEMDLKSLFCWRFFYSLFKLFFCHCREN